MAGDWIKLEHATLDKPEVLELAELLSVSHGDALLYCLRVWMWADQQSRNGHGVRVTKTGLDALMRCPGFANALVHVGWLEGKDGALMFTNFDRHNGNTAKERALATKRQQTLRSRSERDKNVTREEKRREVQHTPAVAGFDRFWALWPPGPRKASKSKCQAFWVNRDFESRSMEIVKHIEAMQKSREWQEGYVPAPLVYLRGERWDGAEPEVAERLLKVAL